MIHIIDFLPSLKVPEGRGFLLVPRLSGNNRLQYVLTCVVEPPDEALPAARARAKARYAKILRLAGVYCEYSPEPLHIPAKSFHP